jgi:hypothetical protein
MYQKDYVLRMVEMLGEMIAAIVGLIKKKDFQSASENLSRIYYEMLRQDAGFFRNIPEEKLTDTLLGEHNFTNGHLEILAELFNTEAELCFAQGDKQNCNGYSRKALTLFEFVDKEQKTYSTDRINKINAIKERLKITSTL